MNGSHINRYEYSLSFFGVQVKISPIFLERKTSQSCGISPIWTTLVEKKNAKQLTFSVKIKSSRFSWISTTFEIKIVKDRSMQ